MKLTDGCPVPFKCAPMLAGQLTPNLCELVLRELHEVQVELDVGALPGGVDRDQRRHLAGIEGDDALDARQVVGRRHGAVEEDAPAHLADVDAGDAVHQRLDFAADGLRRAREDVDRHLLLLAVGVDEQQRGRTGADAGEDELVLLGDDLDDVGGLFEAGQPHGIDDLMAADCEVDFVALLVFAGGRARRRRQRQQAENAGRARSRQIYVVQPPGCWSSRRNDTSTAVADS